MDFSPFSQVLPLWAPSVMLSSHLNLCLLLHLPSISPIMSSFSMIHVFSWHAPNISTSVSKSILPRSTLVLNYGFVCSSFHPRDSQEFPPTPKFKCVDCFALDRTHSPALTSIRHYWKHHGFDNAHLCGLCDVWPSVCCLGMSLCAFQEASVSWFLGYNHHQQ